MATDHDEILRAVVKGTMSADDSAPRLAPGCRLEERTESEDVWEADMPKRERHRTCGRITGCEDPNQNTDWLCGEWSAPA